MTIFHKKRYVDWYMRYNANHLVVQGVELYTRCCEKMEDALAGVFQNIEKQLRSLINCQCNVDLSSSLLHLGDCRGNQEIN